MMDNTLAEAIRRAVRVDRPEASILEPEVAQRILTDLKRRTLTDRNAAAFAPTVQSLVSSGYADRAAEVLFDQLTGPQVRSMKAVSIAMVQRSLDVCLYEAFRHGDPLSINRADGVLDALIADMSDYRTRRGAGSPSVAEVERLRLAQFASDVATASLLLNTEHQSRAIAVVSEFLQLLGESGVWLVDKEPLATLLRRCTAPTRTFFDLAGLDQLRSHARLVADDWLRCFPASSPSEPIPNRSLWYRFLMASDHADRQADALLRMEQDARAFGDPALWDLLCNCASWTLETTLDPDLTQLAEDTFTGLEAVPRTHQYLALAIRAGDRERGTSWVNSQAERAPTTSSRYLEARFYLAFGDPDRCLATVSRPLSVYANVVPHVYGDRPYEARISDLVSKLDAASRRALPQLRSGAPVRSGRVRPADAMVLYNLARTAQEARFVGDVHRFAASSSVPEARTRDTIVLAPNHTNFLTQLPIVAIERARQSGSEVVSMVNGLYPASPELSPAAQVVEDAIMPGFYFNREDPTSKLSPEWTIDLDAGVLEYRGINYYHCVHNSLGIHFRRFSIDFKNEVEYIQLHRNLVMIQGVQRAFEEFVNTISPDRNYFFVLIGIQAGLGSILRSLITDAGLGNVRAVHVCNGFETFDPEFLVDPVSGNAQASFHSIRDLTDLPDTPLGFRPTPADVEARHFESEAEYRQVNHCVDTYLTKVDGRAAAAQQGEPHAGRTRRVLVLGTILPDLSIPHDTGLAHHDIVDWVRHTVAVAERDGVDLIVKPHPAEVNQKMGFYVSERFADLFPESERVTVLPYGTDFHEAVRDADLVVIWSGTSVMELALMGRSYVACSRFAREEYPLGAPAFTTREEYERLLRGEQDPEVPDDARLQAIDIIHRITTSPLREPSMLPTRQLLNGHVWPPRFDIELARRELSAEATQQLAQRLIGQ